MIYCLEYSLRIQLNICLKSRKSAFFQCVTSDYTTKYYNNRPRSTPVTTKKTHKTFLKQERNKKSSRIRRSDFCTNYVDSKFRDDPFMRMTATAKKTHETAETLKRGGNKKPYIYFVHLGTKFVYSIFHANRQGRLIVIDRYGYFIVCLFYLPSFRL